MHFSIIVPPPSRSTLTYSYNYLLRIWIQYLMSMVTYSIAQVAVAVAGYLRRRRVWRVASLVCCWREGLSLDISPDYVPCRVAAPPVPPIKPHVPGWARVCLCARVSVCVRASLVKYLRTSSYKPAVSFAFKTRKTIVDISTNCVALTLPKRVYYLNYHLLHL